ncbi:hypothetical protein DFH08DRAFT_812623 [Mycena albidolilacea]|uniref:Uncharacterized protein n=1 Tax=Mycena albidolilacea TaxID=1033008 RepID=A0AAD7EM19_9AGAR|nr:hypothetical protein DFH08DRAFT_812623 [Mycena albidolilacea]
MVAVPADRQFVRIAVMGLVENPEIFGKTPRAHSNILSRNNLLIQPGSSPEQDQAKKLLIFKGGASELEIYRCIEAEAKHEKEFDGSANNGGMIANRPYMDTWLARHPYIGSVTETKNLAADASCKPLHSLTIESVFNSDLRVTDLWEYIDDDANLCIEFSAVGTCRTWDSVLRVSSNYQRMDQSNPLDIQELLDHCLSYLHSLRDLKSCAQVSPSWVYAAHSRIFRAPDITNGSWKHLLEALTSSPHLISHIRRLNIQLHQPQATSTICTTTICTICGFPFTHVDSIVFAYGRIIDPPAVAALQYLLALPTLRRVKLHCTFDTFRDFTRLWASCVSGSGIWHVAIDMCIISNTPAAAFLSSPQGGGIALQSLSLDSAKMHDHNLLAVCVPEPHNPAHLLPRLDRPPGSPRPRRGIVCGAHTVREYHRECEHAWQHGFIPRPWKRKHQKTAHTCLLPDAEDYAPPDGALCTPLDEVAVELGVELELEVDAESYESIWPFFPRLQAVGAVRPLDGSGESQGLVVVDNIYVASSSIYHVTRTFRNRPVALGAPALHMRVSNLPADPDSGAGQGRGERGKPLDPCTTFTSFLIEQRANEVNRVVVKSMSEITPRRDSVVCAWIQTEARYKYAKLRQMSDAESMRGGGRDGCAAKGDEWRERGDLTRTRSFLGIKTGLQSSIGGRAQGFDARGTKTLLVSAPVWPLPSRRRSRSVATSTGISSTAPLLPALSRELERARVVVMKRKGAGGAGVTVESSRHVMSTPSLPERRTDGAQAAAHPAPMEREKCLQPLAQGEILLLQIGEQWGWFGNCIEIGVKASEARHGSSRLDVRARGRRAWGAGLRSPHEASTSPGNGTQEERRADKGKFIVAGSSKEIIRSAVTLARETGRGFSKGRGARGETKQNAKQRKPGKDKVVILMALMSEAHHGESRSGDR